MQWVKRSKEMHQNNFRVVVLAKDSLPPPWEILIQPILVDIYIKFKGKYKLSLTEKKKFFFFFVYTAALRTKGILHSLAGKVGGLVNSWGPDLKSWQHQLFEFWNLGGTTENNADRGRKRRTVSGVCYGCWQLSRAFHQTALYQWRMGKFQVWRSKYVHLMLGKGQRGHSLCGFGFWILSLWKRLYREKLIHENCSKNSNSREKYGPQIGGLNQQGDFWKTKWMPPWWGGVVGAGMGRGPA